MADPYSLEDAEDHIGDLRGKTDLLDEIVQTQNLFVAGNQIYGDADTASTAVTAATQTQLTTTYTIPGNEPAVGSAYRLRFGGSGTWGSTQDTLAFSVSVGGVTVFANITLGASALAANASFRFAGWADIVFSAVGASGAVLGSSMITITETANSIVPPGTYTQGNWAAQGSYVLTDANASASSTFDTTTDSVFIVKCAWGSAAHSSTITNRHTIFQKVA
jgi:hypothetical protein